MILYNHTNEESAKDELQDRMTELKGIRRSYSNRIELCIKCMDSINQLRAKEDNIKIDTLYDKTQESLATFLKQISLIDNTVNQLENLQQNQAASLDETTKECQQSYEKIKKDYINNSIYNESIMIDFVRLQSHFQQEETVTEASIEPLPISEKVETNGTLFISEVKGKVIMPYTKEEVLTILKEHPQEYLNAQEVVDKVFTRDFSSYHHQAISRFKEAYDLVTKREKYSKTDGINLGIEMFGKRLLHPAIITACRTLDELDVYIDCLEKNEVDDFKIFDIEYELTPTLVKGSNSLWKEFFSGIFSKTKQKD